MTICSGYAMTVVVIGMEEAVVVVVALECLLFAIFGDSSSKFQLDRVDTA